MSRKNKEEKKVDEVVEEVKETTKSKLSPFLEAYKLQNPVKFQIKWDRGELKNL